MKRNLAIPVMMLAAIGMWAAFTATAEAFPTKTTACSSCHGAAADTVVKLTELSNNGTTATYNIQVTSTGGGMIGWTVLDGATNVAHASAATGSFSVAVGKTYTVWGNDTNSGAASVKLTPTAPAPAPTPTPAPAPAPSPTPTPTPAPSPTPTPTPAPSPTPTPAPSPAPAPAPAPTPEPTVTPQPDPGAGESADDVRGACGVRILDGRGHAWRGVVVTLTDGEHTYRATTNRKGFAWFNEIAHGDYTASARAARGVRFSSSVQVDSPVQVVTMHRLGR